MTKLVANKRNCQFTYRVGSTLRKFRESCSCTQLRLAHSVGCPRSTISAIERGLNSPSLFTVNKILIALGFTFRELAEAIEL